MDATVEDALVNWYEVERASRWSAEQARRSDIVAIGAARPRPSAALDGLFSAVEDALDKLGMCKAPAVQHTLSHPATAFHAGTGG